MSLPHPRAGITVDLGPGRSPLFRAYQRAGALRTSAERVGALYDGKERSVHPGMRTIVAAQRAILWIMEQVTDEITRVCRIVRRRQLRTATWRRVRHLGVVADLDAPAEAHRLVLPLIEDAIDGIRAELAGLRYALAGHTSSTVVSGVRHTRHMATTLVGELRDLARILAEEDTDG